MVFLKKFKLLKDTQELMAFDIDSRQIFVDVYPFHIFPQISLEEIDFEAITCFYGGNGSGKSTLLNIIATKLNASRLNPLPKGDLFDLYVKMCAYSIQEFDMPKEIKAITSDDVFEYLLDIRSINYGVNRRKNSLCKEFLENKYAPTDDSIENYQKIREKVDARKKTMSAYVKSRLSNNNLKEYSNGESALLFWQKEIKEDAIYILDEPENSLSAENQIKLKIFIEEAVRFYNCQFIISTHSPFLLSLKDAKIYNLDSMPCQVQKWTTLSNVNLYYNFFKEHENEFKPN